MDMYESTETMANFHPLPYSYFDNPTMFANAPMQPMKQELHHFQELPPALIPSGSSAQSIPSASSSTWVRHTRDPRTRWQIRTRLTIRGLRTGWVLSRQLSTTTSFRKIFWGILWTPSCPFQVTINSETALSVSVQIFPILLSDRRPNRLRKPIPCSLLHHRPPPSASPSRHRRSHCQSIPFSTMELRPCHPWVRVRCFQLYPTHPPLSKPGQPPPSNRLLPRLRHVPESLLLLLQQKQDLSLQFRARRRAHPSTLICFRTVHKSRNTHTIPTTSSLISLLRAAAISCHRLKHPVRLFRMLLLYLFLAFCPLSLFSSVAPWSIRTPMSTLAKQFTNSNSTQIHR